MDPVRTDHADLPSVSFIIPTYNSARTLDRCLRAIVAQDYPQHLVEILVLDGGSTDSTPDIARGMGVPFRVEASGEQYQVNAEARMALGVASAKGAVAAFVMSDNILPSSNWLRQMVQPFQDDREVALTQTLHYAYRPEMALLDRYGALMGAGDPVAYYLDKRDRMSWREDTWHAPGQVHDRGQYLEVHLRADSLPPMGCNGALIRRDLLLKYTRYTPGEFSHSDAVLDLVLQGFNKVAIVKNDIIHENGDALLPAVRKRLRYFRSLRPSENRPRRYRLFDHRRRGDIWKLTVFLLYSLTIIKPTWDAVRGYIRIRDVAWFINPIFCLSMAFSYSMALMLELLQRVQWWPSR